VLVLIHSPARNVLLLERTSHPDFWQSVTGSQEDSESLSETAMREVLEETGICLGPPQLVDWRLSNRYEIFPEWRHRYAPGVTENIEHVFSLCLPEHTAVTLSPSEHKAFRWLPWQRAAATCFSWSNRDAILMLGLARCP
jgi:dATP pyrophosphohydrolase